MPKNASPRHESGPARARRLSQAEIVHCALKIANAEGPGAVSMRRVAAAMGAGAMSLYWYVPNKDELVGLMLDSVAGEVVLPPLPSVDWRHDLRVIAQNTRHVLLRHPWIANFLEAWPWLGPAVLRREERMLAAFDNTGLDVETATRMTGALDAYTIGSVIGEVRERKRRSHHDAARDTGPTAIAPGEYPRLGQLTGRDPSDPKDQFEFGLERLLDGFAFALKPSA